MSAPLAIGPIVKGQSRRRRPIKVRTIEPRSSTERSLFVLYVRVVRYWSEFARDHILPAYATALPAPAPHELVRAGLFDDARALAGGLSAGDGGASRLILRLSPEVRDWTVKAENVHRSQFTSAVASATNVKMGTLLSGGQVATTLGEVYRANIDLVTLVSAETRDRIAAIVWKGFTDLTPPTEIAKLINEATDITRARALRIASDQNTKLSTRLDQERQQQIGIDKFIWIHSGKLHFRPEHKERDGMLFAWDDPEIADDLPGWAINCGCKAQGYVDLGQDVQPAPMPKAVPGEAIAEPPIESTFVPPVPEFTRTPSPALPEADYVPGIAARGEVAGGVEKWRWVDRSPFKSVDELYTVADANQAILVNVAKKAQGEIGGTFKSGGVKGRKRFEEKISPQRPLQAVTDMIRGGFLVETPAQADALIAAIGKSLKIIDEGWKTTPEKYFDRKVLVLLPNGQIGELQFWEKTMLDAKDVGGGHALYERWRSLAPGPEKEKLLKDMAALYGRVLDGLSPEWKAAAGSG